MRIGILPFGTTDPEPLVAYCRERDVDVIAAPATVGVTVAGEPVSVGEEAARVARADCDGSVLLVGADADPALVALAALRLPSPVLLVGPIAPAYGETTARLADIGLTFDRLPDASPEAVLKWLQANAKRERQRGIEAAHKLYGQRLAVTGRPFGADPAQLQRQFGVILVPDAETAHFAHPSGDVNDALIAWLLFLVTGSEAVARPLGEDLPDGFTGIQFARRRGHYVCYLLRGPSSAGERARTLLGGVYRMAEGDQVAALKAACETLDVPVDVTLVR